MYVITPDSKRAPYQITQRNDLRLILRLCEYFEETYTVRDGTGKLLTPADLHFYAPNYLRWRVE